MIKSENITFPITLEDFTKLQEAEMGRKINDIEKEFFSDVVDMANQAFAAGAVGDLDTAAEILEAVDAAAGRVKECAHLAAVCRGWIALGCRKGLELLDTTGLLPS